MSRRAKALKSSLPKRMTKQDRRIGQAIRARRLEMGLTQAQLANECGITFQQIGPTHVYPLACVPAKRLSMPLDMRLACDRP